MKELDVFLKTVVDGMKVMAQGVESLAEKLDGITKARLDEKAKAKPERKAPEPKKKVAKKAVKKTAAKKPATAVDTVLKIINRSKKGVSPSTLMEKTGFAPQKVHNIVYKLKKEGKIKSVGRGRYLKV